MDLALVNMGAALWLGIMTSISPCPLSTNIAAISYVGRKVEKTSLVLFAGLLYTAGRSLAYLAVALLVTKGMISVPGLSMFLQRYMNMFTGPLMLLLGVLLLGIWKIGFSGGGIGTSMQRHIDNMGVWGAGVLGIIFALAFCPVSAGLFFGGLIPLALQSNSSVIMSILYGIGTALPVLLFALLLAFAANRVGIVFNRLTFIELWVRRITSAILIFVGVYLILKHNFGLYFGF
jgi:cytochrome c-type biogenesis protein